MISSPPVEVKECGEYNYCEYRKHRPQMHPDVCKRYVAENAPECRKCQIARKIKEG